MRSLYPVLALVAALAPGINVFDMFWLGTVIGDYDLWQLEGKTWVNIFYEKCSQKCIMGNLITKS